MRLNSYVRDLRDAGLSVISAGCARGRSGNPAAAAAQVRTAAAWWRCEERTDKAERRAACRRNRVSPDVSRYEAAKNGGEALQRSTRSPGGGAWRRSAGMRPDFLSFLEDGLEKRLRPYQQKLEEKRYEAVFTHEDNNEQSEIWRLATC